jgi:hypothetical protein
MTVHTIKDSILFKKITMYTINYYITIITLHILFITNTIMP